MKNSKHRFNKKKFYPHPTKNDPRQTLFNVLNESLTMDFTTMNERDIYLYFVRFIKSIYISGHSCKDERERAGFGVDCAGSFTITILENMCKNKNILRERFHTISCKVVDRYMTGLPEDYMNDPDERYLVE